MTTYDRYLLIRYFHMVVVLLVVSISLFVIVDGFSNLDTFQENVKKIDGGTLTLFSLMGQHYFYQSLLVIDLAGPSISVVSAVATLALMLKSGEIHPVLAAGIPTYRLTLPLMYGTVMVGGILLGNQELVLPRIAPKLQRKHGQTAADAQSVEPQFDRRWKMLLSGEGVYPEEQRLHRPQLKIQPPILTTDWVTLKAEDAIYIPPESGPKKKPGGWLLQNLENPFEEIPFTDLAGKHVFLQPNGSDVFVSTHLTFSQMSRKTSNFRLMGTPQLLQLLQEPYQSVLTRRGVLMLLHSRLTQTLLTLAGLYVAIPLIIRRDRMSGMQQVTNIATCVLCLGVVYGISMGCGALGQSGYVRPEQAAWFPIVLTGTFAGWVSGFVRT